MATGRNWWNIVLIPAAAALAVATLFLWSENRELGRELAALHASVSQEQQQLDEARQAADLLASKDTITIPLAQQPGMPEGSAHVSYNAKTGMLMYDGALAPAPAAKSYQLWLVPVNGKPISAGVFNSAAGMPDHWIISLPAGTVAQGFRRQPRAQLAACRSPPAQWYWSAPSRNLCAAPDFGPLPSFLFSLRFYSIPMKGPQRFRDHHRPIRLLVMLHDGLPRPAYSQTRAVQRVHEFRLGPAFGQEADSRSPRLKGLGIPNTKKFP